MKLERVEEKFEKLYQTFINENFLSMESIGGEIPFYISSYNPSQEVYIFSEIERLKNRLKINGISVYEINLFELVMEMLEDRGILEKLIQKAEANIHIRGKDIFVETESENMYASIDSLVDKLDRQILKHKEKNLEKRNHSGLKDQDFES